MRAAAPYGILGPLSLSLAMSALLATPATGRPLAASTARTATTVTTTPSATAPAGAAGALLTAPASPAPRSVSAVPVAPAAPAWSSWSGSPASAVTAATPPGDAVAARGVTLAARRAAKRGIAFRRCPRAEALAAPITCGKVSVPLDYARPRGKHISLTVSRVRATGPKARRQGALVYNPGGPGASGMAFPEYAAEGAFRRVAAAYDFVGYAATGRSG
ncbi:Protease OS=Streptomyces antimycoticus OX=68175 GN=SANT12839_070350 PE=3 SV=1 [Streptomyces antimycoticus]